MSISLMTQVWKLDVPTEQCFLLLALADHAHDDGSHCHPSVGYLAWKLNRAIRTVQYGLRELVDAGVLIPVEGQAGGRGVVPEYQMDLSKLPQKAPYDRTKFRGDQPQRVQPTTNERVQPTTKGAIRGSERVQPTDQKGAIHDQPTIREPSTLTGNVNPPAPSRGASKGIGPLIDEFARRNLEYPRLGRTSAQAKAAKSLLEVYSKEEMAACWADVLAGRWGDSYVRTNLSWTVLLGNNRMDNWRRDTDGGTRAVPAGRTNGWTAADRTARGQADPDDPDLVALRRHRVLDGSVTHRINGSSGGVPETGGSHAETLRPGDPGSPPG